MESNLKPINKLSPEKWREHVLAAQKFEGSNFEYCKIHNLKHSTFGGYKKKLGFTPGRQRRKNEFIQVTPVLSEKNVKINSDFTDPAWLAEFLKKLFN